MQLQSLQSLLWKSENSDKVYNEENHPHQSIIYNQSSSKKQTQSTMNAVVTEADTIKAETQ